MVNVEFLLTQFVQHIARLTWVDLMLLALLSKAQKLFCGLRLEKSMKPRKQVFSGKIVP
jgi:hypothetical protein